MRLSSVLTAAMAWGASFTMARSSMKPARPPAVPLAVRSPYLNAWLQGGSAGELPGEWPRFWTGQVLGWVGFVAVDETAYNWLGAPPGPTPVRQLSLEYTSTRSIFTFDVVGKVTLTVAFLSPVYADDLARQSRQFSYISVKAKSSDGKPHDVQVYMDVSGEWACGDINQTVRWDHAASDKVAYHTFSRAIQAPFSENGEIANWGDWYLATSEDDKMTWQIGEDLEVRARFASTRRLANTKDTNFRATGDRWPVFAFSHELGSVSDSEVERVFSLGLAQTEVILFAGASKELRAVPGFWTASQAEGANTAASAVAFYKDYAFASSHSDRLDGRIQQDSVAAAGQNYATITTLAVRQTFGALQVAGTPSRPYIFLKEISSNSDIQTVDVIFPALPIFVYLNASLIRHLLEPLYENQESGAYPNKFAQHDLGTFPVARGYPDGKDEPMPLEECGNMIIMTLAYALRTGDNGYLGAHYAKLEQWAGFLVEESLIPANQLSTDDFLGTLANQTNLAIKGIIGLRAMSEIAKRTGKEDKWATIAVDYLTRWKALAINTAASPPHTTLSYGDANSHGLLYNIYSDKLLNLSFVDQALFDMQSNFYPTITLRYGVPLDSRHTWAKSDWQMFAAAVASRETRDNFIATLARWIAETDTNRPMTDFFDADNGGFPRGSSAFVARPVMGGMFALLALSA